MPGVGGSRGGLAEHHDVSPADAMEVVAQLVHQDPVVDHESGFHRGRGDPEGLHDVDPHHDGDAERDEQHGEPLQRPPAPLPAPRFLCPGGLGLNCAGPQRLGRGGRLRQRLGRGGTTANKPRAHAQSPVTRPSSSTRDGADLPGSHKLAISFSTRSSWDRKGSLSSTVRCA